MLNHSEIGHGNPVVLLHGFCENLTLWDYHASFLSKSFRVISIDLPGFGQNQAIINDTSIELMTEEVRNTILKLNIENPIIIGHSLGGYLALAYADMFPNEILGLGLFHSNAFEDSVEKKLNRNKAIKFIEEHGLDVFANNFISPLFNPSVRELYQNEIQNLVKIVKNSSIKSVINVTKAMRDRVSRVETLKKCNIPVMFIVGKSDTAVPLEISLEQCYLPKNSSVHFYEKTGHMGMIERKLETSLNLLSFCSQCIAIKNLIND